MLEDLPGVSPSTGALDVIGFPELRNALLQGQILRPIKRYGRVSKRSGRRKAASILQDDRRPSREDRAKDPRYLYLAIDEASSHVSDKLFRC